MGERGSQHPLICSFLRAKDVEHSAVYLLATFAFDKNCLCKAYLNYTLPGRLQPNNISRIKMGAGPHLAGVGWTGGPSG